MFLFVTRQPQQQQDEDEILQICTRSSHIPTELSIMKLQLKVGQSHIYQRVLAGEKLSRLEPKHILLKSETDKQLFAG